MEILKSKHLFSIATHPIATQSNKTDKIHAPTLTSNIPYNSTIK